MMVAIMQQLIYFNKIYLQVNADCFNFVPNNQNVHKMEDEVILRINKKNQEAKLLLAYLASLPYVEVQEEEDDIDAMPDNFSLPIYCPKSVDAIKNHIADIERKTFVSGKMYDNNDIINESKQMLKRYEHQMVG